MILARYILREHAAPFFSALFVITFLFLIDFLIRILSSILSKGLEWRVVLEIVLLNLAWMLALSIPMAVLVATLMAFGRLASDQEITALKSLGISPFRAMIPVLFVVLLITGGLVYFNDHILPEANFRAAALRNDIGRKKPTALITPRRLIRDFDHYQIWIDGLDEKTGVMRGIRIFEQESGKPLRYTSADSGTMEYAQGGQKILIHLERGENHAVDPDNRNQYVRVAFLRQDIAIDNVDASLERRERTYRTDREMSIDDMLGVVQSGRERLEALREEYAAKAFDEMRALDLVLAADSNPVPPPRLLEKPWRERYPVGTLAFAEAKKQESEKLYSIERFHRRAEGELKEINQYLVEIHKKFSIPVACLVFVFIGAPLGIMARRGGIGTGVVYSLAFFILYWAGMIRGEVMADKLTVSPWAAMWGPNLVLGLVGIFLVVRMARENYLGEPYRLRRLFSRFRRRPAWAGQAAQAPRVGGETGAP